MAKYASGKIMWVHKGMDPHNTGKERPIVIVRHKDRPYNHVECTVMCLGHGSQNENHRTPELKHNTHYTGIKFSNTTHLLPWSIHTIPPAALNHTKGVGELTNKGRKLVATEFAKMFK